MNFSDNPLLEPLKFKIAEIRHLEYRHNVIFFCWGWSDLDKISQTGAKWHVDCGDMAKIETRCRIPIWRTFGRIPWHVILEPPATLQGAATWRIQCHDPRATCHIPGCCHRANSTACHPTATSHCRVLPLGEFTLISLSLFQSHIAVCNNSIRHIEYRVSPYFILFLFFKMQLGFDERRLSYRLRYTCCTTNAQENWIVEFESYTLCVCYTETICVQKHDFSYYKTINCTRYFFFIFMLL